VGFFTKKQNSCLGIDFGSSGIKVVELTREGERVYLSNYALAQAGDHSIINLAKFDADQLSLLLQNVLSQANIKSRQAVISLPVDETFSTLINMPLMPEEEMAQAIPYEARKYVPVPIEEVALDWSLVKDFSGAGKNNPPKPDQSLTEAITVDSSEKGDIGSKTVQVLIVAVPQELIKKIAKIAQAVNLNVLALEQEAFSMVRSLIGNDLAAYLLIDLGEDNIDLIIIDEGAIRLIHTIEKIKPPELAVEITKVVADYQNRFNRQVIKAILTGGAAIEPVYQAAITQGLTIEAGIGDPFARVAYDQKLASVFKEIGPFMAVAVGAAMREI